MHYSNCLLTFLKSKTMPLKKRKRVHGCLIEEVTRGLASLSYRRHMVSDIEAHQLIFSQCSKICSREQSNWPGARVLSDQCYALTTHNIWSTSND